MVASLATLAPADMPKYDFKDGDEVEFYSSTDKVWHRGRAGLVGSAVTVQYGWQPDGSSLVKIFEKPADVRSRIRTVEAVVFACGDRIKSLSNEPEWKPRPLRIGDIGFVVGVDNSRTDSVNVRFEGEPPMDGFMKPVNIQKIEATAEDTLASMKNRQAKKAVEEKTSKEVVMEAATEAKAEARKAIEEIAARRAAAKNTALSQKEEGSILPHKKVATESIVPQKKAAAVSQSLVAQTTAAEAAAQNAAEEASMTRGQPSAKGQPPRCNEEPPTAKPKANPAAETSVSPATREHSQGCLVGLLSCFR